jgi:hypothetical protein
MIANGPGGDPCQADANSSNAQSARGAAGYVTVTQGAAVSTANQLHDTPQDGDAGSAKATQQHVVIMAGNGNTVIDADVLSATAAATCTAGSASLSGSSSVTDVSVNGTAVKLTGGAQDVVTPAGTLHINATFSPASNVLYHRSLWLENSSGDIIVSEAAVAYTGSPCTVSSGSGSGGGGTGGPPPPPQQQFGCRANAINIGNQIQPVVANAQLVPCPTQNNALLSLGAATGVASAQGVYANTLEVLPDPLTFPVPNGHGVEASTGLNNFDFGSGPAQIQFDSVSSQTVAYCSNAKLQFIDHSTVHDLIVGGQTYNDLSGPDTITLPQGTLQVNWTHDIVVNGTTYGRETRSIWWTPLSGPDVIIGDTIAGVSQPQNPC